MFPKATLHNFQQRGEARRYLDDPKGFRPEECDENLSPLKTQKKMGDDVKEAIDATVHEEGAEEEESQASESNETVFYA